MKTPASSVTPRKVSMRSAGEGRVSWSTDVAAGASAASSYTASGAAITSFSSEGASAIIATVMTTSVTSVAMMFQEEKVVSATGTSPPGRSV